MYGAKYKAPVSKTSFSVTDFLTVHCRPSDACCCPITIYARDIACHVTVDRIHLGMQRKAITSHSFWFLEHDVFAHLRHPLRSCSGDLLLALTQLVCDLLPPRVHYLRLAGERHVSSLARGYAWLLSPRLAGFAFGLS